MNKQLQLVLTDLTKAKENERLLIDQKEKYQGLINFTNTGYLILDHDLKIVDANEIFTDITGYSMKDLQGIPLRSFITSESMKRFDAEFLELRKECKDINDLEIGIIKRDRSMVYMAINANLSMNGFVKIVCLLRDISGRKDKEMKEFIESEKRKDAIRQNIMEIRRKIIQQANGKVNGE